MQTKEPQKEKIKENMITDKKYQKESWIYANIVFQYAPYIFTLIIGCFIKDFDFKTLVSNGELIITAFALSSVSILSLFDFQRKKNEPKRLRYFMICLLICFIEVVVYTGIKIEPRNFTLTIVLSVVMNLATIIFSIAANFYIIDVENSINKTEE